MVQPATAGSMTAQLKIQTQPQTDLYANSYQSEFETKEVKVSDKITFRNQTKDYTPENPQTHEIKIISIEPDSVIIELLEPANNLRIMAIERDEADHYKVKKYYDQNTRHVEIQTGKSLTLEEPENSGGYHICWWIFVERISSNP